MVCARQVVAHVADVAVCARPLRVRELGTSPFADAGVVQWLAAANWTAASPRFAAAVDIVFEGRRRSETMTAAKTNVSKNLDNLIARGGGCAREDRLRGRRARRGEGAARSQN